MKVRRTQAERRAATRTALVDAALESLAVNGYAQTTLPGVARLAGLSNGAMWLHFPAKADLMGATVLRATALLVESEVPTPEASAPAAARVGHAVSHLWRAAHQPPFKAMLELFVASRADPELYAAIAELDHTAGDLFFQGFAHLLGPDLAAHPHFARNARLLALALHGVSITDSWRSARARDELCEEFVSVACELFRTAG